MGDWVRWTAIAVLTLPTFATIVFAYIYRTEVATPPGFAAGATTYVAPPARRQLYSVLNVLGIGEGSVLAAPGSQVWAAMAQAMAGGVSFSDELVLAIAATSGIGVLYAWLTVWPRSARFMPSLFGIGIGLLLGLDVAMAIFLGGMLKALVTRLYTQGRAGDEQTAAKSRASDDTMVVGASIFAASAVLAIALVLLDTVFGAIGWQPWYLAH